MFKWSRDYFKSARAAALELRAIDSALAAQHDKLSLQAQSYAEHRSADVDPQSAVDAYIDAERAAEAARVPLMEVVNDALEVLYGPHGRAGVAKLLGLGYADIVCMRWLQLMPWRDVARGAGVSVRWCQMKEQAAFDRMDEIGESAIRAYNAGEFEFLEALRADGGGA